MLTHEPWPPGGHIVHLFLGGWNATFLLAGDTPSGWPTASFHHYWLCFLPVFGFLKGLSSSFLNFRTYWLERNHTFSWRNDAVLNFSMFQTERLCSWKIYNSVIEKIISQTEGFQVTFLVYYCSIYIFYCCSKFKIDFKKCSFKFVSLSRYDSNCTWNTLMPCHLENT